MSDSQTNMHVFADSQQVASRAALFWAQRARQAIAQQDAFYVALSGGSTPRLLYQQLAQGDVARQIPWQQVHLYFGDERVVPPDHPDSNYRMVRESLLDHVPLPASQIHPMVLQGHNDETSARQAASRYARELQQIPTSADGWPQFDLLMLGMGADGHTASLFPGTAILQEQQRSVASVHVAKLEAWRVSLTLPVIQRARALLLLICGADKAERLKQVLETPTPTDDMPITHVIAQANVHLYLDQAAARLLDMEKS